MKTYNGNSWTPARFRSFVVGALRQASNRWPPKTEVKKAARVRRGVYMCAGYECEPHEVPASLPPKPGNKRRINNAVVDHREPAVCPDQGWVDYDTFIERLFCETENLDVLCDECHQKKSNSEKERRANVRRQRESDS